MKEEGRGYPWRRSEEGGFKGKGETEEERRIVLEKRRKEEGNSFREKGGVGVGEAIVKGFNGLRKVRKKEKNNPTTYFHNIIL